MPVTEPGNLADVGRNGDTEETPVTNDPDNKGFPARLQTGELVFITKTRHEGHKTKVLIDADGNEYVDSGPLGALTPYVAEEASDDTVEGHPVEVETVEQTDVVEVPGDGESVVLEDPIDDGA